MHPPPTRAERGAARLPVRSRRAASHTDPLQQIESARTLSGGPSESNELHIIPIVFVSVAIFAKGSLMFYCLAYRQYPSVHVFFVSVISPPTATVTTYAGTTPDPPVAQIDHRNDIVVNSFGKWNNDADPHLCPPPPQYD